MQYKKDTGINNDRGFYNDKLPGAEGYVKLPVYIGQPLYTNISISGSYQRASKKPYEVKVIFIGINESSDMRGGFFNVIYNDTRCTQYCFYFSDIGVKVFYTKEEAENSGNK